MCREIQRDDMTVVKHFSDVKSFGATYDGVFCKCGAAIVFRGREPYEPVVVVCPECSARIQYG